MNVSKTLKDYITITIEKKLNEKAKAIREEEKQKVEKIRPKLDKLASDHVQKARKIFEDAGLNPDQYGYSEINPYSVPCIRPLRYIGIPHKNLDDYVRDIILRIELDEVPKSQVKAFIDNYSIDEN